jgi:hypothetical protein
MSSNKNGLEVVALFAVALGLLACGGGGSGGGDGGAGGGSLPEAVAYVKACNTGTLDGFSQSVALSADGNTLAVGADGEGSNATGIGGNQADDSAFATGAVYVFTRSGGTWSSLSPSGSCGGPNCAVLNIMSRGAPRRQGLCFYYSPATMPIL